MTRARRISLNLGAVLGAFVTVVGGAWGGGKQVVSIADARYVSSRQHAIDSMKYTSDMSDVKRSLSAIDSSLKCVRGKREYCL